jgi:hypothetical protein
MIYHCLNADQYTVDDLKVWKKNRTTVITPHDIDHHSKHKKTKTYHDRNKNVGVDILCIPHAVFAKFSQRFDSKPNTGTLAVIHLLSLQVATLTVVGFDFYSSLYWFRKDEAFRNAVHLMPHKPRVQFEHFKEYIKDFDNFIPIGRLKEMLAE